MNANQDQLSSISIEEHEVEVQRPSATPAAPMSPTGSTVSGDSAICSAPDPFSVLNAKYAVIEANGSIYDRQQGTFLRKEAFTTILANRKGRIATSNGEKIVPLSQFWLQHPKRSTFPFLDLDPTAGVVTRAGGLNTWRGFSVQPEFGDISPFIELLEHLIPTRNRHYVLTWLAAAIQRPEERFHVALVIWSRTQGVGKNLLVETVGSLFDPAHIRVRGQEAFQGDFNDWQRDALFVVFDEVVGSGDRRQADRIKTLLTATSHTVNKKFEPTFEQKNRLKAIFLSNHPDAVFLGDTDRRFYVVEATNAPVPYALVARFVHWLDHENGLAHLLFYLRTVDTSDFNGKERAPMTDAKADMIASARSDLENWLADILAASDLKHYLGREVVTADELSSRYRNEVGQFASTKAVSAALGRSDIHRLGKHAERKDGSRPRCYALRNRSQYEAMTGKELGAVFDAPLKGRGSR